MVFSGQDEEEGFNGSSFIYRLFLIAFLLLIFCHPHFLIRYTLLPLSFSIIFQSVLHSFFSHLPLFSVFPIQLISFNTVTGLICLILRCFFIIFALFFLLSIFKFESVISQSLFQLLHESSEKSTWKSLKNIRIITNYLCSSNEITTKRKKKEIEYPP